MAGKDVRLAVLIDADNISANYIKPMMLEIARYGNPTIKRIYGDWTKPQLGPWKTVLLDHAISPVQQFGYTTGKNATDSTLIIDAMDILYTEKVDGFCLVSSDSDFTRLATRLREAGKIVYGIGEKKTPTAFVAACDRFIFLEILETHTRKSPVPGRHGLLMKTVKSKDVDKTEVKQSTNDSVSAKSEATVGKNAVKATKRSLKTSRKTKKDKDDKENTSDIAERESSTGFIVKDEERSILKIDEATIELIASSIADLADEEGWAFLGDVGNLINKKSPSFDSRNYGFAKMSKMVQSLDWVEYEHRTNDKNPQIKLVYVRNREE